MSARAIPRGLFALFASTIAATFGGCPSGTNANPLGVSRFDEPPAPSLVDEYDAAHGRTFRDRLLRERRHPWRIHRRRSLDERKARRAKHWAKVQARRAGQ